MTDVQLHQFRNRGDGRDIVVGQPVAGVNLHPQPVCQRCTPAQGGQFGLGLGQTPLGVQVGIVSGVQFDHRRADPGRGFDLAGIVADEHRHPCPRIAQGRDVMGQPVFIARHVQPALRRAFRALFWDETDRMGADAQGDGQHVFRRGAFKIQGDGQPGPQCLHIGIADVAAVFAQMGSDAIGTRRLGQQRGAQRVGPDRATGVAQGGDVVDVDAKAEFAGICHGCSGALPPSGSREGATGAASGSALSAFGISRAAASARVARSLWRFSLRSFEVVSRAC